MPHRDAFGDANRQVTQYSPDGGCAPAGVVKSPTPWHLAAAAPVTLAKNSAQSLYPAFLGFTPPALRQPVQSRAMRVRETDRFLPVMPWVMTLVFCLDRATWCGFRPYRTVLQQFGRIGSRCRRRCDRQVESASIFLPRSLLSSLCAITVAPLVVHHGKQKPPLAIVSPRDPRKQVLSPVSPRTFGFFG
jgi:hypothetical protein